MKEKYNEKKCKGCLWKTKCDDGHFICLFANCMKELGRSKKDRGIMDKNN
jgi:hypothetical protein